MIEKNKIYIKYAAHTGTMNTQLNHFLDKRMWSLFLFFLLVVQRSVFQYPARWQCDYNVMEYSFFFLQLAISRTHTKLMLPLMPIYQPVDWLRNINSNMIAGNCIKYNVKLTSASNRRKTKMLYRIHRIR